MRADTREGNVTDVIDALESLASPARRVLELAREDAILEGSHTVTPEHLLHGLLHQQAGAVPGHRTHLFDARGRYRNPSHGRRARRVGKSVVAGFRLGRPRTGSAKAVFDALGLELNDVRRELNAAQGRVFGSPGSSPKLSPATERILVASLDEAAKTGSPGVGTHHMLLGLLCECDTIASTVLARLGLTLEVVRKEAGRI